MRQPFYRWFGLIVMGITETVENCHLSRKFVVQGCPVLVEYADRLGVIEPVSKTDEYRYANLILLGSIHY